MADTTVKVDFSREEVLDMVAHIGRDGRAIRAIAEVRISLDMTEARTPLNGTVNVRRYWSGSVTVEVGIAGAGHLVEV